MRTTTSVTLFSGNIDLADGDFTTLIYFWSLEFIKPGDSIHFEIGNEGVGTANVSDTYAWNCSGTNFLPQSPFGQNTAYSPTNGGFNPQVNNVIAFAQVSLPHSAIVTDVLVLGVGEGETWDLRRVDLSDATNSSMASAAINTEDSSISNATIDNENYTYFLVTSSLDIGDWILGARIIYTLADRHNSTAGYYEFELTGIYEGQDEST